MASRWSGNSRTSNPVVFGECSASHMPPCVVHTSHAPRATRHVLALQGKEARVCLNDICGQSWRRVEKGSFWETLQVTDQSKTLGNSAQHRIHQLRVSSSHRAAATFFCARGAFLLWGADGSGTVAAAHPVRNGTAYPSRRVLVAAVSFFPLNEGHRLQFRVARVALGTGCNHGEGNRRASRNDTRELILRRRL